MLIHVAHPSVLPNSYLNCNPAKSPFIYETNSDFKQERILTQTGKLKVNRSKQIGMCMYVCMYIYIYIYIYI